MNSFLHMQAKMKTMHKTFEIVCPLGARDALDRVERLLAHEGVKYEARERSIASTHTPIAVLGIQPRLYTNKNWVGINPFAFISGLDVRAEAVEAAITKITVRINRRRSLLIFLFWVVCGSLAARGMPGQLAGHASDVDLLVSFEHGAKVTLFTLADLQSELAELLRRPVDLVPKEGLKPAIRGEVLAEALTLYAA